MFPLPESFLTYGHKLNKPYIQGLVQGHIDKIFKLIVIDSLQGYNIDLYPDAHFQTPVNTGQNII